MYRSSSLNTGFTINDSVVTFAIGAMVAKKHCARIVLCG